MANNLACDEDKCEFPYFYGKHNYTKCSTIDNDEPWCVTNQTIFDSEKQSSDVQAGWDTCSKECELEHKICEECENPFTFTGLQFKGCTVKHSDYWDQENDKKLPWCILNQTKFDQSGELEGWEYCSRECAVDLTGENNGSIYVACIILLVLLVLVLIVGYGCRNLIRQRIWKSVIEHDKPTVIDTLLEELKPTTINAKQPDDTQNKGIDWSMQDDKLILVHQPPRRGAEHNANKSSLDTKNSRTITLIRQFSGDPESFDPALDLKQQVKVIPYNSKREVERSAFTIDEMIGSGYFGNVCKGTLTGLYRPNNKTPVAIKTINDASNESDLMAFLGEIKIMSNIEPHLNLVNMVGSCTSEFAENKNLWLLIEFCQYGDLKNYLIKYKSFIIHGKDENSINSRLLIQWTYDVSKGMQYLARRHIMHGDLAARNILLEDELLHSRRIVAKISDFGLSKSFYDQIKYKKQTRVEVPWKWMALEYLKDDFFTITSDVWSFAVLVWEMLSFGKNPYGYNSFDEVLDQLQAGYRLPCPTEANEIKTWSPQHLYDKLSKICYVKDPTERGSFSDVVACIESDLSETEKILHAKMREAYIQIRANNYIDKRRHDTT